MMKKLIPFLCIAVTILCTVYGQLITKSRVNALGLKPNTLSAYYTTLFLDPWFVSGLVAVLPAGLCWIYAIRHIPLSIAYPFMGLTFAFVLIGSSIILHETVTVQKVIGTVLIIAGISIIAMR
ncbi:MAG: EamA family transporter [Spirochaetota bacterium]